MNCVKETVQVLTRTEGSSHLNTAVLGALTNQLRKWKLPADMFVNRFLLASDNKENAISCYDSMFIYVTYQIVIVTSLNDKPHNCLFISTL